MTREQYIESRVYDEHEYIDVEEATIISDGSWFEYDDNCWLPEVGKFIDDINDAIKDVDPFEVNDPDHHPGWYYHDDMAFCQGPFSSPEACYDHACNQ